jgi:hypothetical protein
VREDRRIVGGEGWQEKVYNREEWKKLLKMARNCHILHMPMELMNKKIINFLHTERYNSETFIDNRQDTSYSSNIKIKFLQKYTYLIKQTTK